MRKVPRPRFPGHLFDGGAHGEFGALAGGDLSSFEDGLKGGELLSGVVPDHDGVGRCRETELQNAFAPGSRQANREILCRPVLLDDLKCLLQKRIRL